MGRRWDDCIATNIHVYIFINCLYVLPSQYQCQYQLPYSNKKINQVTPYYKQCKHLKYLPPSLHPPSTPSLQHILPNVHHRRTPRLLLLPNPRLDLRSRYRLRPRKSRHRTRARPQARNPRLRPRCRRRCRRRRRHLGEAAECYNSASGGAGSGESSRCSDSCEERYWT